MKILKRLHSLFFKGFSPIVTTVIIGLVLFAVCYYFLAYKTNLLPSFTIRVPQILKGDTYSGPIIETTDGDINYDDVSPVVSDIALDIDLVEGQSSKVVGTDIFVKAIKVDDLTGRGCLGGALGCADRSEIEVSRHLVRQNITLLSPKTAGVLKAEKNKAVAFGYTISLLTINDKKISIRVEIVE
jgi:hypothetical protein